MTNPNVAALKPNLSSLARTTLDVIDAVPIDERFLYGELWASANIGNIAYMLSQGIPALGADRDALITFTSHDFVNFDTGAHGKTRVVEHLLLSQERRSFLQDRVRSILPTRLPIVQLSLANNSILRPVVAEGPVRQSEITLSELDPHSRTALERFFKLRLPESLVAAPVPTSESIIEQ